VETVPHYVYRCYDQAGKLLYVGCTRDVEKRMQTHRYNSPWHGEMSRTTAQMFTDQPSALVAEREAIEREHPQFNVSFTDKSTRQQWNDKEIENAFRRATSDTWRRDFIWFSQIPQQYPISAGTLKLHVRKGLIRAFFIGGSWVTMVTEVERYIRENKRKRGRPHTVNPQQAAIILPAERPTNVAERNWDVLMMRHAGMTLKQIGQGLGVTRERVRQLEAVGLRQLNGDWPRPCGRPGHKPKGSPDAT
jgi:predicted GIY-YIG superfamily endonuclease